MSQFAGTRCDVCRKIKEDSNKWIKVSLHPTTHEPKPGIWIGVMGELDVCSDNCLQKLLGSKLQEIRDYDERRIAASG